MMVFEDSANSKQSRAIACVDGSPVLRSPVMGALAVPPEDVVPHSCSHCQRLVFVFEDFAKARYTVHSKYIVFDFTYADVARAVAEGCLLCQLISGDPSIAPSSRKSWSMTFEQLREDGKDMSSNLQLCCWTGSLTVGPMDNIWFGLWNKESKDDDHTFSYGPPMRTYTKADNAASRYISTRRINTDVGSKQTFELARTWLERCLESHEECVSPGRLFMPKRVLEIVDWDNRWIRLCQTDDNEKEAYAALSYCWGGDQLLKTTTELLPQWEFRFPWEHMSRTIQDAIIATQELGIRFLWIDSLCIIQDDAEDIASEISQMPSIYSNATVTVAASRSKSTSEGFLYRRPSPDGIFEMPFLCPGGEMGSVYLFPDPLGREEEEPLDSRGWALQERLLSTRVLEYGTRQLLWICKGAKASQEGYTDGWKLVTSRYDGRKIPFSPGMAMFSRGSDGKTSLLDAVIFEPMEALKEWHRLVEAYTSRALTVPSDRVLAISGIAERYGTLFPGGYLAGLWQFYLHSQLLWSVKRPLQRRPDKYQAPSWSWMSINVTINPPGISFTEKGCRIEVIDCQVQPSRSSAPYGAVRSGYLKLRGRMKSAEWMRARIGRRDDSIGKLTECNTKGWTGNLAAMIEPDALETGFTDGNIKSLPVVLLEVWQPQHDPDYGPTGLILRDLGDSHFQRLGVFTFNFWLVEYEPLEERKARQPRYGMTRNTGLIHASHRQSELSR